MDKSSTGFEISYTEITASDGHSGKSPTLPNLYSNSLSNTYSCLLDCVSRAQSIVGDTHNWGTSFSLFDVPVRR